MNKAGERLVNGILKENPTFVLMLGMCPTLAVTTSAINGLGMGLTTAVVLALSNMIISLLRKVIPNRVRIPAFIVIIASFVTVLQLLLEAYLPELNEALGVYIPLIVVNCIILGRAEAYAYFNPPIPSLFDGIGMGLGFSVALTAIGLVREVLGSGKAFGIDLGLPFEPIGIFVLAPGAFFVLAVLTAVQNYIKLRGEKKGKDMSKIQSGCGGDCMNCGDESCGHRFYDMEAAAEEVVTEETVAAESVIEGPEYTEEPAAEQAADVVDAGAEAAAEADGKEAEAEKVADAETAPVKEPKKPAKKKKATKKAAEPTTEAVVEGAADEKAAAEKYAEANAEAVAEAESAEAAEATEATEDASAQAEEKPAKKKKTTKKSPAKKTTKASETKESKVAKEPKQEEDTLEVLDLDEEEEKA